MIYTHPDFTIGFAIILTQDLLHNVEYLQSNEIGDKFFKYLSLHVHSLRRGDLKFIALKSKRLINYVFLVDLNSIFFKYLSEWNAKGIVTYKMMQKLNCQLSCKSFSNDCNHYILEI